MAIRNSSYTRFIVSLIMVSGLTACQTARKKGRPATGVGREVGAPPVQEPPPTPAEHKKVAVILGPGGAKAFAEVGVLRAFQQQRIPVEKVVGLEWGALIGALYADKGQVNDVEWKLYKMEQRGLPRSKGFFSNRLGDSVRIMDDYLQDSFLKDDVANTRVAFSCPSRSVWTGLVTWQNRGLLREAVHRCLPFPPIFKVQGSFIAAASAATEAIDLLRIEGFNVIILVNVLGSAVPVAQDSLLDNLNYVILWQEIRRQLTEASKYNIDTVNVDTSKYPMTQFEAKKDLINMGDAAGQKAATELINKYGF